MAWERERMEDECDRRQAMSTRSTIWRREETETCAGIHVYRQMMRADFGIEMEVKCGPFMSVTHLPEELLRALVGVVELKAFRELLEAAIGFIHVDSGAREEDRLAEAITACRGAHA